MHLKPRFRRTQFQQSNRAGSPLVEGVFDFNVDVEASDGVRITLWDEWNAMLTDLRAVGPVWNIVRNPHCVLAVQGTFPELAFFSDQWAAQMTEGDSSLRCHFPSWRQAVAFDSGCCCGRIHGVEFENGSGEVFQRICLAKGTDLQPFVEWIQTHQATGLELDDPLASVDLEKESQVHARPLALSPGALEVASNLLRTVLITAAQRDIPLAVGVIADGATQTTRIDVTRASEAHGWLVLSGEERSLYVEAEPAGTVVLEPRTVEGEAIWTLSLVHPEGHRLMHLRSPVDGRDAWNQLIRKVALGCSEPGAGL